MSRRRPHIPTHVGIIMDGNRRWAKARGLSTVTGHQKGYEQALKVVEHGFEQGIRYISLYAFSTQNWNRARNEVAYLMRLMVQMLSEKTQELHDKGIRLKVIGTRNKLSKRVIAAIESAEELTRFNKKGTLLVAFNYESWHEIVDAVKKIVSKRIPSAKVTKKVVASNLYTAGFPDPDLVIRTSGEHRISGFMVLQAAHAELYFTNKLWPAFTPRDFDAALADFSKRNRRFGT